MKVVRLLFILTILVFGFCSLVLLQSPKQAISAATAQTAKSTILPASSYLRSIMSNYIKQQFAIYGSLSTSSPVTDLASYYPPATATTTAAMNAWLASTSATSLDFLRKDAGFTLDLGASSTIALAGISVTTAAPGRAIILYGHGFSQYGDTVYFDDEMIPATSTVSGKSIQVRVPVDAYGMTFVSVANANGDKSSQIELLAEKPGAIAPRISISTSTFGLSDKLVIYGKGFAKENQVVTSLGQIRGVPVTGSSSLVVSLGDMQHLSAYETLLKQYRTPVPFFLWVMNVNGMSNVIGPVRVSL